MVILTACMDAKLLGWRQIPPMSPIAGRRVLVVEQQHPAARYMMTVGMQMAGPPIRVVLIVWGPQVAAARIAHRSVGPLARAVYGDLIPGSVIRVQ